MKNRANKPTPSEQGFTLIELMIAMVILGIGLFSIAALQITNANYNTGSKKSAEGYTWAMDQVERLLASKYVPKGTGTNPSCDATAGSNFSCTAHSVSQGPYTVAWNVGDNTASVPNSVLVNVNVTWNSQQVAAVAFTRTKLSF